MGLTLPTQFALLGAATTLMMIGAVSAWSSGNATKRVIGAAIALIGAMAGLAALGAPPALLIVGAAVLFAQIVLGAALAVRLQEAYGSLEMSEIDAADAQSEPVERAG
jgi:hypothetical protein